MFNPLQPQKTTTSHAVSGGNRERVSIGLLKCAETRDESHGSSTEPHGTTNEMLVI